MERNQVELLRTGVAETQVKLRTVMNRCQEHECCYLMGLTGAGKSSLTCYLCGANIQYEQQGLGYALTHSNPDLPRIGNDQRSCTTIPGIFKTPDNMIIYDPPGSNATTGVIQQILDSYCNAKMFKVGCKAKIVVMIEFPTLQSSRGKGLADVAVQLHKLFGDNFCEVINSCLLVVSKVDTNIPRIHQKVTKTIENISNLTQILGEGQMLLKSVLVQKLIMCFPIPQLVDNVVIDCVKRQIQSLPSYHISQEPNISLSPKAQNTVEDFMKCIQRQKIQVYSLIAEQASKTFRTKMQSKADLEDTLLRIRSALQILTLDGINKELPQRRKQLQDFLFIEQTSIDKLNELSIQTQFCISIHSDLKVNFHTSQLLQNRLIHLQKQAELKLSKILTKQEIENINQNHRSYIESQAQDHRLHIEKMQRQSDEKMEFLQHEAEENNRKHQQAMRVNHEAHMALISQLNSQIACVKSRGGGRRFRWYNPFTWF